MCFLAGATQRIRFVTSVMIVPYRNPVVTAKMLASLDVLSGGRVIVGLGVGWMKEEFDNLKAPDYAARGRVTDEYIRAFRELWTSENPSFNGKFGNFSDIIFLPKPVQKPRFRSGSAAIAKQRSRAGELGDGWHPIGGVPTIPLEPEDVKRDLATERVRRQSRARSENNPRRSERFALRSRETDRDRRRRFLGGAEEIASDIRDYRRWASIP